MATVNRAARFHSVPRVGRFSAYEVTGPNWAFFAAGANTPSAFAGSVMVGTTIQKGKFTTESDGSTLFPLAVNNTAAGSGGSAVATILRNGVQTGSITNTSSATGFNTTSDKRVKENIAPIADAGAIIDEIYPVNFNFKVAYDPSRSAGTGFLAQDLDKVVPEAVTEGDDNEDLGFGQVGFKQWSVDYSKLVPYTVAELKSLRARVASLEAEVAAIKAHDGIQ